MKFLIFYFLFLNISVAFAKLGFYNIDDIQASNSLKKVTNSVFKISIPDGNLVSPIDLVGASSKQEFLETMKSYGISEADSIIYNKQISDCEQQKVTNFVDCKFFEGVGAGTIFTVGKDGDKLWTSLHTFRGFLIAKLKESFPVINKGNLDQVNKKVKEISLPIVLENKDYEIVFGESKKDVVRIKSIHPKALLSIYASEDDLELYMDYVEVTISKKLGSGLIIGSSTSKETFTVGFPYETEDRANFNAPDSNGYDQYVTVGKTLTAANFENFLIEALGNTVAQNELEATLLQYKSSVIATDNDGVHGLSGAPLVNSKGEVLGVFGASIPYDGLASAEKKTFSVSFQYINSQSISK